MTAADAFSPLVVGAIAATVLNGADYPYQINPTFSPLVVGAIAATESGGTIKSLSW